MAAIRGEWSQAAIQLFERAQAGAVGGARRVKIEEISPQIDAGNSAVKSIVGEPLHVKAQVYADGHDVLAGALRYRKTGGSWNEVPLKVAGDDSFAASMTPRELGTHEYQIAAWIDPFASWQHAFPRRTGDDAIVNLTIGSNLVQRAVSRASGADKEALTSAAKQLAAADDSARSLASSDELAKLMAKYPDRELQTTSPILPLVVNRERARFSSWYEVFPRSMSSTPGAHGKLSDVTANLDHIKSMGFDVVYMTPIHPIGETFRKGANNAAKAVDGEPGVPYAIGNAHGGHTALHPDLGTMDDFDELVRAAKARDMDIGMDLAFQASPDHPWVAQHPSWFKHRPDGTVQYAENPPKKYQDVYPFDFESKDWPELWTGLTDSVMHWADRGVRAFRVDNPHTKPFDFWKHLITEVKAKHPDTVFLSEAFDRPQIQDALGRAGFDQTYTYFPWKTTPDELKGLGEHYAKDQRLDYMTPSHWPTTHDILPENLQNAGREAFALRATLAGTMSPTWGNYGPAYEQLVNKSLKPGSIEFLDSEKYQLVQWKLREHGEDISDVLAKINAARHARPALQSAAQPRFLNTGNKNLAAFLRSSTDNTDHVLVVANTDTAATHSGRIKLPLTDLGFKRNEPLELVDELDGTTRRITGGVLDIAIAGDRAPAPAHIFHIRRPGGVAE